MVKSQWTYEWLPLPWKRVCIFICIIGLCTSKVHCPVGKYATRSGACKNCRAGFYGIGTALSSPDCSGVCPAGYFCPEGSAYPTNQKCAAGRYGSSPGQKNAMCSGSCKAGYYCPLASTKPDEVQCGGPQYFCPEGSGERINVHVGYHSVGSESPYTMPAQSVCEKGHYCVRGVSYECPAGRYGAVQGLSHYNCSAICPVGHYCPQASVLPTPCPAGTYGDEVGLTSPACSGLCALGHFCVEGSVSYTQERCPAGRYGDVRGLKTDGCSLKCSGLFCEQTVCAPGFYCPLASTHAEMNRCGGNHVFCPAGSAEPTPVTVGYYTVGNTPSSRVAQIPCEPGWYCEAGLGVRQPCPAGKYGSLSGLSTSECSGDCQEGFYCPTNSSDSQQFKCGDTDFYCPTGVGAPISVSTGYYSTGGAPITRPAQTICPPGSYCVDGVDRLCPAGRYGETSGLSSSQCSGPCYLGHYCPIGSVDERQVRCPAGRYGKPGLGTSACTGPCKPGYYCEEGSVFEEQKSCGHNGVYCPVGSPYPLKVDPGHFSTGGHFNTRNGQQLCDPNTGSYVVDYNLDQHTIDKHCPSHTMPLTGNLTKEQMGFT